MHPSGVLAYKIELALPLSRASAVGTPDQVEQHLLLLHTAVVWSRSLNKWIAVSQAG